MQLEASQLLQFEDAMPIRDDAAALRQRAQTEGYLYFAGLLDRETVLALRRQFTDILAEVGWLKPGTEPMDAIAGRSMLKEGDDEYWPAFDRFQKLEAFHALPHDERIIAVLERLFGERVLAHPRHIGRILFPDTPSTPPHQDYTHIKGTTETWTCWMPLGDAPTELGGLAVLAGSHAKGLLPIVEMPGAGGSGVPDEHLEAAGTWRTTDYQAGDVLLVHSHAAHASLPNQTGDRMRLSVDYRYQPASQPVHRRSLLPHMGRHQWEELYADWRSKRYQYYWEQMALEVVEDE